MTAYSFGNRWVGVVALGTPPPPEPLHKMALRLRAKLLSRRVSLDATVSVPVDTFLQSLARLRVRMTVSGRESRSQECLDLERRIRAGRTPALRPWLTHELLEIHRPPPPPAMPAPTRTTRAPATPSVPAERIVPTGWAQSYPQAPDSPWVPPVPPLLLQDLQRMDLILDENALLWVRWACLHSSYLYESVPDSPISAEVLDLLSTLGRGWMRLAMLDRARTQRGDLISNAEVSGVLTSDRHARALLAEWAGDVQAPFYGKGEAALIAARRASSAPEAVATQILGALSLVTASQVPADALLDRVSFTPPAAEPDWATVLTAALKRQPEIVCSSSGPDHDKTFTVTVSADGLSASAVGRSVKFARKAAARSYVLQYLPHAAPDDAAGRVRTHPAPRPYRGDLPQHVRALRWAQQAFEVADPGLMSQALTHRSWIQENRAAVAAAHQRDYGALATEGSEVLTTLVRHHYVLHTLSASSQLATSVATNPPVSRDVVVALFDAMPVHAGVLRAKGMPQLSLDVKEDVTQAIAAAAWRANGDLLMERQPVTVANWIRAFEPPVDPSTQLQGYCARLKVGYDYDYERRGPDHQAELRATITFEVDGTPRCRGPWRSSKTAAKQAAAAAALDWVFGHDETGAALSGDRLVLLRALFLVELRTADPERRIDAGREIVAGTLGVDLLAAGDFDGYLRWARVRSQLVHGSGTAVATRLEVFYEAVLTQHRRAAVRQWSVQNTVFHGAQALPVRLGDHVRRWQSGSGAGRLALLEDLLTTVRHPDPIDAALNYVQRQAQTVAVAAGIPLEVERSSDPAGRSMTLHLPGVQWSEAFEPVVEIVDSIVGGAIWARESQVVSVTIPAAPSAADPLSRAGLDAVQRVWSDPWLDRVSDALTDVLLLVEYLPEQQDEPSTAQLEELVRAEHTLMMCLRDYGAGSRPGEVSEPVETER
ncbi:putative dsRNA-binding protein [Rhodococcus pyridinivorans]|uniref:putative dsRNA-binding protein n=1 Tax=Rhodococcus pyridinivorans TaxID=103816 RepID=UPI001E3356E7|nr:putative dsRNA-binding protein [Rhodococcus pyridinivorans]MCD5422684.1 putative dsRNA-binding protein [Rhodococcus pyridinivorans]